MSQSSTRGPEDGAAAPPAPGSGRPGRSGASGGSGAPSEAGGTGETGGGSPLGLLRDPWFRFAATFGILAVSAEILYYAVLVDTAPLQAYLRALASISVMLLETAGIDVEHTGTTVRYAGFAVQIAHGCDAIQICALLTCAMIAFPSPWKAKLVGLVLGIAWLQFLNQMRIVTLLLIGAHHQEYFEDAHLVVWPTFLIIVTVATWIAWVRLASLDEPEPSGAKA